RCPPCRSLSVQFPGARFPRASPSAHPCPRQRRRCGPYRRLSQDAGRSRDHLRLGNLVKLSPSAYLLSLYLVSIATNSCKALFHTANSIASALSHIRLAATAAIDIFAKELDDVPGLHTA